MAPCQAYLLSQVLAVIDGVVTEADGQTCDEPVEHVATIRRTGIALHVEACEPHRIVIALGVVGYVSAHRIT